MKNLQDQWLTGTADIEKVLEKVQWLPNASKRADTLTFIANLMEISGDSEGAEKNYLKAHKLCRYYNRAHYGLTTLRRQKRLPFIPGYQNLKKSFENRIAASGLDFTPLQTYVYNWNALPPKYQDLLKYSLIFWLPHIQTKPEVLSSKESNSLAKDGRLYVRFPFQRTSDIPGFQFYSDDRADSEWNYRLVDDLRAVSGNPQGLNGIKKMVVVDTWELANSPYSNLNAAAHEVTHQFHDPLVIGQHLADVCIGQAFDRASIKEKAAPGNGFADGYAAFNQREYFAQGVNYYTITDLPATLGRNHDWLQKNDSCLFAIVDAIARNPLASLRKLNCISPFGELSISRQCTGK